MDSNIRRATIANRSGVTNETLSKYAKCEEVPSNKDYEILVELIEEQDAIAREAAARRREETANLPDFELESQTARLKKKSVALRQDLERIS